MGWIKQIFPRRREKKQIKTVAILAHYDHLIDPTDIDVLTSEGLVDNKEVLTLNVNLDKVKQELPKTPRDQFSLVYFLMQTFMRNGGNMTERQEKVALGLVQVLTKKREKAIELVSFIKSNIRNGLSQDDSFSRLGYLLASTSYV